MDSEADWDEYCDPMKPNFHPEERWKRMRFEDEKEYPWDDEEEDTEEEAEQSCEKKAFTLDAASSNKPWCKLMVKGNAMDSRSIQRSLCRAASLGHLDELNSLVSRGADVNLGDEDEGEDTPLMYAVRSGNLEAVEFLVRSGAHVNFSHRLLNPFLYSTDSGNLAIIEFLISNGADVNVKSDNATPLHYAAWFASVKLVEYLVNNGYDVNARDKQGATPLYNAISSGNLENVVFLLDHGAEINAKDQDGKTPIHCAVINRNNGVHDFLTYSIEWELRDEVRKSSLDIVKMLIIDGTDLNAINKDGKIPCHDAVYAEHSKICESFNDLHEINTWYPRYDAHYRGMAKIIRLLLERGADVNAANKDGDTPLDLARNQRCRDACKRFQSPHSRL